MSLVGSSAMAHALRPGDKVIWRQKDGVCTVLVVHTTKTLKIEHAPPFYRTSYPGVPDANFTHVAIGFKGLPWPCIFGPGDNLEQYNDPPWRGD